MSTFLATLSRAVGRPSTLRPLPTAVRCQSSALPSKPGESTAGEEAMREHAEHVQAALTRHSDKDVLTAEIVSGAPVELQHRAVRIFMPAKSTMQSGGAKSEGWRIDWDILQGGGRWENRLMGWASSADYMQGTRLNFRTKEDAIHFAEKQGWDYYVSEAPVRRVPPKAYAENFVHIPGKLRIARTK